MNKILKLKKKVGSITVLARPRWNLRQKQKSVLPIQTDLIYTPL